MDKEESIIKSYDLNASEWSHLIRNELSESRKITNPAILAVVSSLKPTKVLDIGAGEGWLVRELCGKGMDAYGVEGSAPLVDKSRSKHEAKRYICATYESLSEKELVHGGSFDLAVANFSLIGEESSEKAIDACSNVILSKAGYLVVQTLHPCFYSQNDLYKSGWRDGTWAGLPGDFTDPAPWYYRTLTDWMAMFSKHDFLLESVLEPAVENGATPVSIILICKKVG